MHDLLNCLIHDTIPTRTGFGDIVPITPEGKLVVSAGILVGTAVIPLQAGAPVEALLARQELKKKKMRSKTSRNKRAVNGESNDKIGDKFVLETTFECPNCGSAMH
jgi:hypothetical protein